MQNTLKLDSGNRINLSNYHINSSGKWKPCKRPKRRPDYTSFKKAWNYLSSDESIEDFFKNIEINPNRFSHELIDHRGNTRIYYFISGISSLYWYGEDKRGKYVIRESDHWGKVASCQWKEMPSRNADKLSNCAKTYLIN